MSTAEARFERQLARLRAQQRAIVELSRRHAEFADNVEAGLRAITETAARVIGVARASVWMLDAGHSELRCLDLFERDKNAHASGIVLYARDYPGYFAALETGRAIDAHDARTDPRTSEFRDGYLVPLSITSMMDAAVREEGRVSGVICHEQVGDGRTWTPDEVSFAGALSDQVSLVLAAAARRKAESEREKMRDQLLHAQKLESIGLLAGGVAHDFNNLLATIMANVGYARGVLDSDSDGAPALDDAMRASRRAAQLTRQLLTYSGHGESVVEPIDVADQVREIADLLAATKTKKVRVAYDFEPGLPTVEADPGQFQQIIMNMIVNAAEAIGNRPGAITVSTARADLTVADIAGFVVADGVAPGLSVRVTIADTGPGMSQETLARMFDPFFSTKGKGRGLGLSAVIGIIRAHHAGLRVTSEIGRGTTFDIYFAAKRGTVVALEKPASVDIRGDASVLVIDDEEAIGRVVRRVLTARGFRVILASSGREGLDAFGAKPDVKLVLLDMTMPDLSGAEVLSEIATSGRAVKVVMMSGFGGEQISKTPLATKVAAFLPKPFTPDQLLKVVATALPPSR